MVTVQGSRDPGQGSQVRESLDRVLRWTSRRANRLRLYGRAAELSQNEVWLLDAVDSAGQLRLSDLATWQGVDKSTITPQVRKLEGRGLLQRSSDATDRRAVRLVLTPRGRALQKRRAESGAALIDALLQGLAAGGPRRLRRLLPSLRRPARRLRPADAASCRSLTAPARGCGVYREPVGNCDQPPTHGRGRYCRSGLASAQRTARKGESSHSAAAESKGVYRSSRPGLYGAQAEWSSDETRSRRCWRAAASMLV